MISVIDLFSADWSILADDLRAVFEAGDLALLLGSGISQFTPSHVPAGTKISGRFREEILARLPPQERVRVSYLTHKIPFEALMARLTELNAIVARDVVLTLTMVTEPNGLHCQVADLLGQSARKRKDLTIVTTNYDMGVTEALRDVIWPSNISQPNLVMHPQDVTRDKHQHTIFHIHGATDDPETFVLDYNTEFQLESWKKRYLHERLRGKTLLVLGFSGYDLDVSEALATVGLKRLIWVHATRDECSMETWSVGARNLADAVGHDNVIALNVNYHIQAVLEPLTFPVTLERNETNIDERFRKVLDAYATPQQPWLTLWARWTAIRAGCSNLANSLTPAECALLPQSQQQEIQSFGYYYTGKHAKGAALQRDAAFCTINESEPLYRYLYHRNNEAEFYNRGGLHTASGHDCRRRRMVLLTHLSWRARLEDLGA
jgi:hypothetical protein